ncbi:S-layer homology domain-containing protein [Sporosarcina beigongshangi]|uniref:S-layer homology domain-containing protein n=1 Tax=Sporosarcina beigongshangi TaxID=2782538 RepID=UPI001939E2B3|nr:S-layer homology domain-containing protein [Sporosarcina beigongshangi]
MNKSSKLWKLTMASAMLTGTIVVATPSIEAAPVSFKDLKPGDFGYSEIMNLTSRGVIGGYQDSTFRSSQAVTRGQSAKILAEALNLDLSNVKDPKLKDVPQSHPYYTYIAALANNKIIAGYKNGKFGVNDTLKRGQMAKILSVAYKFEASKDAKFPFKDVPAGNQEAKYIQALVENKVTQGTTATTFAPNGTVTRGQMAIFIYRSDLVKHGSYASATIRELKNGQLLTSAGTYSVSDSLKKSLFAPTNAQALNGASVSVRLIGGIVSEVDRLELNASGSSLNEAIFDGGSSKIGGDLTIQGNYLRVKNLTVDGDLTIGAKVQNGFTSQNIKVGGDTSLNNTGSTSTSYATVVFQDATLNNLFADKKTSSVILEGKSAVKDIKISQNTKLIADSKMKLAKVEVVGAASEVELDATITNLEVKSTPQTYIAGAGVITNILVDTPARVQLLSTGKITNLTPSRISSLSLGANTEVTNLKIPLGMHATEVIDNFNSIVQNVQQIDGKKNTDYVKPTNPTTPPKPTTPTTPGAGTGDAAGVNELIRKISPGSPSYIADARAARAAYNALPAAQKRSANITDLEAAEKPIVANTQQLKEALQDGNLAYIILANNIVLTEYIEVNRRVVINGDGKTLSIQGKTALSNPAKNSMLIIKGNNVDISNLTIDAAGIGNEAWIQGQPMYIGMEIDNRSGTVLNNVTFRNGHVGLFINATSTNVILDATNITTQNQKQGGIAVNIAAAHNVTINTKAPFNTHTHPGIPAIWAEGGGTINVSSGYNQTLVGSKLHFNK